MLEIHLPSNNFPTLRDVLQCIANNNIEEITLECEQGGINVQSMMYDCTILLHVFFKAEMFSHYFINNTDPTRKTNFCLDVQSLLYIMNMYQENLDEQITLHIPYYELDTMTISFSSSGQNETIIINKEFRLKLLKNDEDSDWIRDHVEIPNTTYLYEIQIDSLRLYTVVKHLHSLSKTPTRIFVQEYNNDKKYEFKLSIYEEDHVSGWVILNDGKIQYNENKDVDTETFLCINVASILLHQILRTSQVLSKKSKKELTLKMNRDYPLLFQYHLDCDNNCKNVGLVSFYLAPLVDRF